MRRWRSGVVAAPLYVFEAVTALEVKGALGRRCPTCHLRQAAAPEVMKGALGL